MKGCVGAGRICVGGKRKDRCGLEGEMRRIMRKWGRGVDVWENRERKFGLIGK